MKLASQQRSTIIVCLLLQATPALPAELIGSAIIGVGKSALSGTKTLLENVHFTVPFSEQVFKEPVTVSAFHIAGASLSGIAAHDLYKLSTEKHRKRSSVSHVLKRLKLLAFLGGCGLLLYKNQAVVLEKIKALQTIIEASQRENQQLHERTHGLVGNLEMQLNANHTSTSKDLASIRGAIGGLTNCAHLHAAYNAALHASNGKKLDELNNHMRTIGCMLFHMAKQSKKSS